MTATQGPCAAWDPIWCCTLSAGAMAVTGLALDAATEVLYHLSGQRFGLCTFTLRPCRHECANEAGWPGFGGWWEWGAVPYPRPLLFDGVWSNVTCGVCGDRCSCTGLSEAWLPGPIGTIIAVKLDGTVLVSGSGYRVDDFRKLVRLGGGTWPTCFAAGTLILTDSGLVPIEAVRAGQRVLTHRNRWRKVVGVRETGVRETGVISGRGGSVRCTLDHRFWAAELHGHQGDRKKLGVPEWRAVGEMAGHAWATPAAIEPLDISLPDGWTEGDLPQNFWWVVGRWIGDGWTDNSGLNARVSICCGEHEADDLAAHLADTGWAWRRTGGGGGKAERFRFSNKALHAWLRTEFGFGAAAKRLPAWLLGSTDTIRRDVLAGYVSADGWNGKSFNGRGRPYTSVHTVSRELALGTRLLAATLGHSATVYEGRLGKLGVSYRINWPDGMPNASHSQAWTDNEHLWGRVRKIELDQIPRPVYDLEVEDDHSFVADGFVVHNCQDMNLADTEVGTWSVTLTIGEQVPVLGRYAVAELACEIARGCAGETCVLPANATQITRQGISIDFPTFSELLANGSLGLRWSDLFVATYNPQRLRARPRVFDVDGPSFRRVGT